jgi:hypothetical protein
MLELWLPLGGTASRDWSSDGSLRASARQSTRKRLAGPAANTAKALALLGERSEEDGRGSKAIATTGRTEYRSEWLERATGCPGRFLDRRADDRCGSAAHRGQPGGGGANTAGWRGIKRGDIPTGAADGLACHRTAGTPRGGTYTRAYQEIAPFSIGTRRPPRACCPCVRPPDRRSCNPGNGMGCGYGRRESPHHPCRS